jgi:hypothetical protein
MKKRFNSETGRFDWVGDEGSGVQTPWASEVDADGYGLKNLASAMFDQIVTPANPAANHNKLYFKSDGKLYKLNSAGAEVEVGAGGAFLLDQTTPQTFTNLGGGTGLLKVTAGLLGLDISTYVTGTPWTGLYLPLSGGILTGNLLFTDNTLGSASAAFSDLFLASGGVINWNAGNATITHSSGLLTSNVPFSVGTSLAITAGTIELGHGTDTTISRSGAGVIAVESVVIPSISSTNTLTNKRITKRTGNTTSSATPTINTDNVDMYQLTAQAADITSMTTNLSGTPTEGQPLWISIVGTGTHNITWGTGFEASTVALPTTGAITTSRTDLGFVWNSVSTKWRIVAVA